MVEKMKENKHEALFYAKTVKEVLQIIIGTFQNFRNFPKIRRNFRKDLRTA